MTIRPITIFYSWQSDLPNNVNRSFIEEALSRTTMDVKLRDLGVGDAFSFTAAVDRDTRGHLGTPDIAATIFSKIEEADIFVADVSIVSRKLGPLGRLSRRVASLARTQEHSSVRATPTPT